MICFRVLVNNEYICTAGVGDGGVLHAIVGWIRRDPAKCPDGMAKDEWCCEELDIGISGLTRTTGHVRWTRHPLSRGDEVRIVVLDQDICDPPSHADGPRVETQIVKRRQLTNPTVGGEYEIQIHDIVNGHGDIPDSVEVDVTAENVIYKAMCFKEPGVGNGGRPFWAGSGSIYVPEFDYDMIVDAVSTLVMEGNFKRVFRREVSI